MMLKQNHIYLNNLGVQVNIVGQGRVDKDNHVRSSQGDYYNRETGAYIEDTQLGYYELDIHAGLSISNHDPIGSTQDKAKKKQTPFSFKKISSQGENTFRYGITYQQDQNEKAP